MEADVTLPSRVTLVECGPREGFQFEGIGQPDKISTADKIRLVEALAETGMRTIQFASFVSPRQVPQMADSEAVCAGITKRPGVDYTGIYLNDVGLKRAIATGKLTITGRVYLTASEAFSLRNQKRNLAEDLAMQRKMAALFRDNGYPVEHGGLMAAFGCNYEGEIPRDRVVEMTASLHEIAAEAGGGLKRLSLSDTMGWANPELIRRTVGAVRERWPDLRISLHLHDTRGLGIANVYAGLLEGVDHFDTGLGGLGGCPFAGHKAAAGNVCSEEVVFLCRELGIETGVDLDRLIACARLAETIVGHALPSKLLNAGTARPSRPAQAA
jgi:hydroxymethylglutaryl-CoA lyase